MEEEDANISLFRKTRASHSDTAFSRPQKVRQTSKPTHYTNMDIDEDFMKQYDIEHAELVQNQQETLNLAR